MENNQDDKIDELGLPRFYLIVHNVAKKNNIGNMVRSASAFGCKEIVVAGTKRDVSFFGAHGTQRHVKVTFVNKFRDAVRYVKEECNCLICGVEIKDQAKSVLTHPFPSDKNTAFIMGNEGHGLTEAQSAACDFFVYIPHYGDGTASLNVTVAASIIFHQFGAWAKYPEHARNEEKFVVKTIAPKSGIETEEDMKKHEQRKLKKQELQQQIADSGGVPVTNLFESDES